MSLRSEPRFVNGALHGAYAPVAEDGASRCRLFACTGAVLWCLAGTTTPHEGLKGVGQDTIQKTES